MYVMLMLMLWDVNTCLTPRGVTARQSLEPTAFSAKKPLEGTKPTEPDTPRVKIEQPNNV
jgi:hypothetical protein